jgi:hypothetical protein
MLWLWAFLTVVDGVSRRALLQVAIVLISPSDPSKEGSMADAGMLRLIPRVLATTWSSYGHLVRTDDICV